MLNQAFLPRTRNDGTKDDASSRSCSVLEGPSTAFSSLIPRGYTEHALGARDRAPRKLAISEVRSTGMLSRLEMLDAGVDPVRGTASAINLSSSVLDDVRAPLPMSAVAAFGHLLKSNLGAGCLALPLVFASTGVGNALALFAAVAVQGVYSMLLLTRCKGALQALGVRAHTFEDCGDIAFGPRGKRLVEALVVTLQLGICCIYLSLLRTNLHAGAAGQLSERAALLVVYCPCACLSLLRDLSAIWPLSTAANAFMLTAVVTACATSVAALAAPGPRAPVDLGLRRASFGAWSRCLGTIFFAFEGVALVLPVENAFSPLSPRAGVGASGEAGGPPGTASAPSASREPAARSAVRFERLLVGAMGVTGAVFVCLGTLVAEAFPQIDSASVTAYLAARAPDDAWLGATNALVSAAVLFSYPLQLQPAVLVFDRLARVEATPDAASVLRFGCVRVALTTSCALVVLAVPALELLIALLGALCQAALALLPFAISLQLSRLGLVPLSRARAAVHVLFLAFCALAMVIGTYCALSDMLTYVSGAAAAESGDVAS